MDTVWINEVVLPFRISLCVQDCNTTLPVSVLVQIVCLHINVVNIVNKKDWAGSFKVEI